MAWPTRDLLSSCHVTADIRITNIQRIHYLTDR